MKKLLLVLCIAFAGQVYGQLDGLNKAILESMGKKEQLFTSEISSFGEYSLNINDYTMEQVKINNRATLDKVVISMSILTYSKDIIANFNSINNLEIIYYGMLTNKCSYSTLISIMKLHIRALYNNAEGALSLIKGNESLFNGTHAQNILNMKRDLRKLLIKCSELLKEA
ncbi:hypothetical protein OAD01_00640 [Candidatus Marinimicrobia bacterium]|nr:hypothetical protein [Candidatus Neomarinimicrobiota bacterium]